MHTERETKNGAVLLMPMRPCPIKHYSQNPDSERKLSRISRRLPWSIQPSMGPFCTWGPVRLQRVMLFLTTTVHSVVVKGGCRTKFNGRSYKLPLKPNMLDS